MVFFQKLKTITFKIWNYVNQKFQSWPIFQDPKRFFTIPLILMLAGLVIRCLSLIFDSPELRYLIWSFGFLLILILWTQKAEVLANFLNNFFVQGFLFLGLRAEDVIYSYKGYKGYLAACVFACSFGHTPAIILFVCFGANPFIWYWFLMIVVATYLRLRNLFIFPDLTHVTAIEDPNYNPHIDHPDKFTWNLVVQNANTVLLKLHGRPVINQLSPKVGNFPLRYAGIRYMSGITVADYALENPKQAAVGVLAVVGVVGSLVGGYTALDSRKLDLEARKRMMEEKVNYIDETHKQIAALQEQRADLKPGDPEFLKLTQKIRELHALVTEKLKEWSGLRPTVDGLPGTPYPNETVKATSFYEEAGIFGNIVRKIESLIQFILF